MTIPYPLEVETHTLGPPPPPHAPFDVAAYMELFVQPIDRGVRIAGRPLAIGPDDDPRAIARELRAQLLERLHERRPDADEHTWASFVNMVRGMLAAHRAIDADLRHTLLATIDGL